MRYLRYVLFIAILLFGISFACLNATIVSLNYYIGQSYIPLSLLLALVFCCGTLIGWLINLFKVFKLTKLNHQLNSRLKILETEVTKLNE